MHAARRSPRRQPTRRPTRTLHAIAARLGRDTLVVGGLLSALACGPRHGTSTRPSDGVAPPTKPADAAIDAAWIRTFLAEFSADELAGRFTLDTPALDRAATMLASEYRALGLRGEQTDYRVPYTFAWGSELTGDYHVWVETSGPPRELSAGGVHPISPPVDGVAIGELAYLGRDVVSPPPGKRAPSLASVRGRIAVIADPAQDAGSRPAEHTDLAAISARLAEAGALGLLVVGGREGVATSGTWPIPVLALRDSAVAELATELATLFGAAHRGVMLTQGTRVSIAPRREDAKANAYNVVAWIPGTESAKEVVLVGAHFDHIGTATTGLHCRPVAEDATCNGADDNGSGTAVVLGIAKALVAAGIRPKRTIAFAHFSGEEMGLFGSKALAELPEVAGGKVVAMINFDMVGRLGAEGLWVGAVGSSSDWLGLLSAVGDGGIPTVYEASVTARSDHASFYSKQVPVLFFFTGLHDDYHRVGDEFSAINVDGMVAIGNLALDLVARLGDGAAIRYTPPLPESGLVTRLPGSVPATVVTPKPAPP